MQDNESQKQSAMEETAPLNSVKAKSANQTVPIDANGVDHPVSRDIPDGFNEPSEKKNGGMTYLPWLLAAVLGLAVGVLINLFV